MTQVSCIPTDAPKTHDDLDAENSQNLQVLSKQLQALVRNAEVIRSQFQGFKDELSRKLLWLRPSVGGISAISCCEKTPQRGFTKISISNLGKFMEMQLSTPGRKTPEKQMQSWLIQSALKSGGRLKLLDDLLGGQCWLVSDEIAIQTASKKKVVADLLIVRVDAEGLACLVNAELKSNRVMETFRQVICFRTALEHPDLQESWKTFAEVMTEEKFRWHPSQDTRGVVIWPAVGKNQINALANKKRKNYARVDVIGYQAVPGELGNYTLEFEKLAENA
jgi:hypothetical protein